MKISFTRIPNFYESHTSIVISNPGNGPANGNDNRPPSGPPLIYIIPVDTAE